MCTYSIKANTLGCARERWEEERADHTVGGEDGEKRSLKKGRCSEATGRTGRGGWNDRDVWTRDIPCFCRWSFRLLTTPLGRKAGRWSWRWLDWCCVTIWPNNSQIELLNKSRIPSRLSLFFDVLLLLIFLGLLCVIRCCSWTSLSGLNGPF